jgi:anti-sigma regulatory factor (Ser/Thr protein kinase)
MTDLAGEKEPSSAARRFARDALEAWAVPGELLEQVELVVSELVGNAVKHAGGATRLELAKTDDGVRVTVRDRGAGEPRAMRASPLEEGHRGLFIVDTVSARWGYLPEDGGKAVWAEFRVPTLVRTLSWSSAEPVLTIGMVP